MNLFVIALHHSTNEFLRIQSAKEKRVRNKIEAFLYKTSKTDTAANKQRSPHPVEQDEAKETATWQREEVSYKQKIKEQDTIKAILKENHELLNSNKELKEKVDELTKIHIGMQFKE